MNRVFLIIAFLSIFLICLFSFSCNTTNPPVDKVQPGRRDYEWTMDTISGKLPNDIITLVRIWGSSPNDVWAVGPADAAVNSIWHYDGNSWTTDSVWRQIDPFAIYGFGPDNIWLGNKGYGSFWKYNGNQWNKFSEFSSNGYSQFFIDDLWGKNSNDIYAVGAAEAIDGLNYKAIILHFNGVRWDFVQIPNIKVTLGKIRYDNSLAQYFIYGITFQSSGDIPRLYKYSNNNLEEIDSNGENIVMSEINGHVYFIINHKAYKYNGNQMIFWKDFSADNITGEIYGRSESDFFATGNNGILHYNGTNFQTILPQNLSLFGAAIFEKKVFFLCYDFSLGKNIIVKGTLN